MRSPPLQSSAGSIQDRARIDIQDRAVGGGGGQEAWKNLLGWTEAKARNTVYRSLDAMRAGAQEPGTNEDERGA